MAICAFEKIESRELHPVRCAGLTSNSLWVPAPCLASCPINRRINTNRYCRAPGTNMGGAERRGANQIATPNPSVE